MKEQQKRIRLLIVLIYMAFAFAFRITMSIPDSHPPDLSGDLTMNYDVSAEIIGAKSIIDGTFDMYKERYSKDFIRGGVAISYPPLTAYLQTPIVYVGLKLGLKMFGLPMIIACGFPYIILSGLCGLQAGAVLRKVLNVTDEKTVTAAVFLLLFSSLMFWVVTYSARFEFVAALFLLLAMSALSGRRYGWAGIALGFALMTKQIVLPAALAFLAVVAVRTAKREIAPRKAFRLAAGLAVPFAILIPFYLASPHDLWVGLFQTPVKVPILKVSFVNAVLQTGKWIFDEESLRSFLMLHSNTVIMAACVGFILYVAIRKDVRPGTSRFCALVALASLFFPVLAKYPSIMRYAVAGSVFVVLWGASRKPGFPYDALWFVVLQSFILDHVPVIWKQYVGLTFYVVVGVYVYYFAFKADETDGEKTLPQGAGARPG